MNDQKPHKATQTSTLVYKPLKATFVLFVLIIIAMIFQNSSVI